MSRTAHIVRNTGETNIDIELDLDPVTPVVNIDTGVGFYDHMLHQLGKHGGFSMNISVKGDLHIDAHHTLEDTAIALGQAFAQALGDKRGVVRFADASCPLDEVLAKAVVDLSGRPYAVHEEPSDIADHIIGSTGVPYPTSMTRHIIESFAHNAKICLHLSVVRASNPGQKPDAHHVVEAQFKSLARALKAATRIEAGNDSIPSTKGVL